MELDQLDRKAAEAFEGYVVRKDLVRKFSRQFPVPTYVVEFMLGRYCATIDEDEIKEGLEIVQRQLSSRTVKAGEEELFKAGANKEGTVKLIDMVSVRFSEKDNGYLATLPSLSLKKVRIPDKNVDENERLLTGGFYAEITLEYDAMIADEKGGTIHSAYLPSNRYSCQSAMCWTLCLKQGNNSPPRNGKTSCCVLLVSNLHISTTTRKVPFCYAWCLLSSVTTIWWSWVRAVRERATYFNRSRPTLG